MKPYIHVLLMLLLCSLIGCASKKAEAPISGNAQPLEKQTAPTDKKKVEVAPKTEMKKNSIEAEKSLKDSNEQDDITEETKKEDKGEDFGAIKADKIEEKEPTKARPKRSAPAAGKSKAMKRNTTKLKTMKKAPCPKTDEDCQTDPSILRKRPGK